MTKYVIVERRRQCFPEFDTLAEARHRLREYLDEDMARVKSRYGQATKIKDGVDNYRILIGDKHSGTIWSQLFIVEFK